MDEIPTEVLRGSLDECLSHLRESIDQRARPGTRANIAKRQLIADFCGVGSPTVWRWLSTSERPKGEKLCKLFCYLMTMGYRVTQFERSTKSRKHAVELIGFGVFTTDEITSLVGYTERSRLFKYLAGTCEMSEPKNSLLWEKWKELRITLEQKRRFWWGSITLQDQECRPHRRQRRLWQVGQ